jgi:hypothetical protein
MEQQTGPTDTKYTEYINIAQQAQEANAELKEKNEQLGKKLEETENKRQYLQSILNKSANPHPVIIVLIVVSLLVILWFIHYLFIKPDISGEWHSQHNNVWRLNKKFMSNNVSVKINERNQGSLDVIDNLVEYNGLIGVWNYNNTIVFLDGTTLTRSLN